MTSENKKGLRTWIEVDRKTLHNNYKTLRSLADKKVKFMAVVKSNAYGHGLVDFALEMEKLGVDFLGVDSIVEALALRSADIKSKILVLGYTLPENIGSAKEADVSITISSLSQLDNLLADKSAGEVKIHIKVDTGMHRQGFLMSELPVVFKKLHVLSPETQASVEGLYTHFAAAKNPSFPQDTRRQLDEFEKWINAFKKEGFKPVVHAAATAGLMVFPESHFDMVRVGIGLYGFWPARTVEEFIKDKIKLEPALSWKTIISEVKEVPAGDKIGYDLTEKFERNTKIAVCPVGYWHGFDRHLSGVGRVIVNGKKARVLGRVSMDMIVVDVTDIPEVKEGEEVFIIGKDGKEEVSIMDHADICETSHYETVTRINPLIKRIYK